MNGVIYEKEKFFAPTCTDSSMDLVFAVDSSTSLLPGEFEKVKEFLKKLVGQLPVGAERVRVGLVRFSSDVDVIAYLDQSDNIQEIRNFISSMAYKEGGTNTYTAFKVIREDVLTVARGDREESPDVVVVITDGKPWRPATTRNEAQLLQQKGASVVAFGVGSEISPRDLQQMSSGLVHNITGFDDLQGAADIFREFLCVGHWHTVSDSKRAVTKRGKLPMKLGLFAQSCGQRQPSNTKALQANIHGNSISCKERDDEHTNITDDDDNCSGDNRGDDGSRTL
nr:hypothetical protein BaRGS_001982 [Batillaria attramentaria]